MSSPPLLSVRDLAVHFPVHSGVLFQREVWCRYVCALGNLGAIYSLSAPLSVRANPDVCATCCTTHECHKGSNSQEGCPTFHHPLYARDSHRCKGADYQARFEENPRRAVLWDVEQLLLDRILRRFLPARPIDHLDFACGTGRILGLLEGRTRTSTGVDVSASMLAVARERVRRAELVEGDLTRDELLRGRRFDLITAFRFFPNAEEELRRDAIAALATRLADGGILVLNNHRNLSSLFFRLARLLRPGADGGDGMWDREVVSLAAGVGLAVRARYHAGIVPESESRVLRPRALVAAVERLAARLPLAGLSEDVIYVCARAAGAAARPGP